MNDILFTVARSQEDQDISFWRVTYVYLIKVLDILDENKVAYTEGWDHTLADDYHHWV